MDSNIAPHIRCCPLCDSRLIEDGDYLQCQGNTRHRIRIDKEWNPYMSGDKSRSWLIWRIKVRLGKMIQAGK